MYVTGILYCFHCFLTAVENEVPVVNPYMVPSSIDSLCKPSDGMHQLLFAIEMSKMLIREVRRALYINFCILTMLCYEIDSKILATIIYLYYHVVFTYIERVRQHDNRCYC